jgi:tetratricopeptide (TPR) repeat protein
VGQPDKAAARLQNQGTQQRLNPGEWDWLMAQTLLLNGQYADARARLESAIAAVRHARAARALEGFESRVRLGGPILGVPQETNMGIGDTEREAMYLFSLAILRIEMGEPRLAIAELRKVLELAPRFRLRSLVEFYWPLLTDEKPPAKLPPYDPKNDVAVLFEKPKTQVAPAKPQPAKATDAKPAAPKTAPPKAPSTTEPAKPATKSAEKSAG